MISEKQKALRDMWNDLTNAVSSEHFSDTEQYSLIQVDNIQC